MSKQRVTLAHGPDGYIVQAIATGFDPESDSDHEVLRTLKEAIDARHRVIAFDESIEVQHIYAPEESA